MFFAEYAGEEIIEIFNAAFKQILQSAGPFFQVAGDNESRANTARIMNITITSPVISRIPNILITGSEASPISYPPFDRNYLNLFYFLTI